MYRPRELIHPYRLFSCSLSRVFGIKFLCFRPTESCAVDATRPRGIRPGSAAVRNHADYYNRPRRLARIRARTFDSAEGVKVRGEYGGRGAQFYFLRLID